MMKTTQDAKVDTIAEELRNRILARDYGTAGRLPTIRVLAEQFGVSRATIDAAQLRLQAEGLLVSHGAGGLFVNVPEQRFSGVTPSFHFDLGQEKSPPVQVNLAKTGQRPPCL